MEVQLPSNQRPAFSAFINLDAEALDKLQSLLQNLSLTFAYEDVAKQFASDIGLEGPRLKQILEMLVSMCTSCERNEWNVEEFAEAIFRSALAMPDSKLHPKESTGEQAKTVLVKALSRDSRLWVVSKGVEVLGENERLLEDVRILTEMRPVFSSDADPSLKGVIFIHQLRLEYRDKRGLNEFFVTIDSSDFDQILNAVERARKKEASVRSLITGRTTEITIDL